MTLIPRSIKCVSLNNLILWTRDKGVVMSNFAEQAVPIKNVNSPFTELFSLLTKYEILR